jgi:hypothetical protein
MFAPLSVPDDLRERATTVTLTAPYHDREARRLDLPIPVKRFRRPDGQPAHWQLPVRALAALEEPRLPSCHKGSVGAGLAHPPCAESASRRRSLLSGWSAGADERVGDDRLIRPDGRISTNAIAHAA